MLAEPTKEEIEKYLDFAYKLALDPARSGYPTYTDGIKTREDFEAATWRQFYEDGRKILLFEKNGRVEGWLQFDVFPEANHLELTGFNIADHAEQALAELEAYCIANYPGYGLYFGFPKDNVLAVHYLAANGWTCIEHSYNDVLHLKNYQPLEECGDIVPVTRENFGDFQAMHRLIEGDMYWNSERLYQELDRWSIWLYYRGGDPAAAVYYTNVETMAEIFGVDFANGHFEEGAFRALVVKSLNACKKKDFRHVTFFNDEQTKQAALACGFECVGEYVCYYKKR